MLHSLLKRQLRKSGLEETAPPLAGQWQDFLERINRTYTEADQERYLLERSLMVSSEEMQEVYEQLRRSETRYALAAQGANDGLWDWDLVSGDVYYSPRWLQILGIEVESDCLPHKSWWLDRIHPDEKSLVTTELETHLEGRTVHFQNEHRVLHSDGEYRWVLIRGMAVRNERGEALRIAGSLSDITERKFAEEKLAHDALHDPLTGLANRKNLGLRLAKSLKRHKCNNLYKFAILFIDLDRFKTVNDSLGHQAGDDLLLKISQKLENIVRPSDLVARLGGDEFVILLDSVKNEEQTTQIAERVLSDLQTPVTIAGQKIYASASIGVVIGSTEYDNADDLLRGADMAMYRAKVKGKGRFELFDMHAHSGALSLLQLEIDLRQAIESNQFVLHYQPIVLLNSETVIGFEALVRWNHPTRGLVPPGEFIPVAEETGLILPIGHWVLHEACRQMQEWRGLYKTSLPLIVSVNLSARQLAQKDLVGEVSEILAETGFDPTCLKLEITESVIMNNAEQAVATVNELREMGVRVSIDDFGTGYSSLSYLHRFPIDTLKVDRSFIMRIGSDNENSEIVQTIITLANNLGMHVVAEGVETVEQLHFLRQVRCEYGQGFYYSRPVTNLSAAKIIEELAEKNEFPMSSVCEIGQACNFTN